MRVKWRGTSVTNTLTRRLEKGIEAAGIELAQRVRDKLQIPVFPRSSPGEPPRMETGVLIASYGHEPGYPDHGTRVGSDAPYAAALEVGTNRIAPRPHLVSTLIASANDLAVIIVK